MENSSKNLKSILVIKILFVAFLTLGSIQGYGATYYSIATGNWNANTTWSSSSGGAAVGSGVYPVAGDVVYIERGYTVTVSAAAACATLTIGTNTSGATSTLTISSNQTLTLTGNLIVGYNASYKGYVNMTASGSVFKIGGSITLTASSYTFNTNSGNSGTVQFTSTTGGQTIPIISYYNLSMDNTSGTNTVAGNISVNGTLTTTSGGTFSMSTYQLTGNLNTITNNGTISTSNTSNPPIPANKTWGGSVILAKTDGGQSVPSNSTFTNFTCSNTSGTNTARGNISYSGTGTFTTTSGGTLAMGSYTLSVYNFTNPGTITSSSTIAVANTVNNSGTLTLSNSNPLPTGKTWGGTVQYSNTGGTVAQGTYNNLTLSNSSGTNTINGNIVVNGTLTTTSGGALSLSSSSYSLSGTLSTITNNGTIVIANTNATPLPTGKTWGGKVTFNSSGAKMVSGTYNNIDINANVTVSGTVNIGGILNWTNNAVVTTSSGNTINITNTATAAITNYNSSRFINGPFSRTIAASLTSSANNYVFPIGKGTSSNDYLPYSITTLTTGASVPVISVEVFKSDAGGSADGTTLGSLSTGEYWLASFTGDYTNGSVSLDRGNTGLSGLNGIGRCATQGGTYSSLGGTVSGNALNTSSLTSNSLGYFVLAKLPFYSRIDGNWNTAATWSNVSCGGAAASAAPGTGDIVTICGGNVVSFNATSTISKLIVTGSGSKLQLESGMWDQTLTVTGNTYIDEGGTITDGNPQRKFAYVFNNLLIGTNTTSSATSSFIFDQEDNNGMGLTISGKLTVGNCEETGTAVFDYSPIIGGGTNTLTIADRTIEPNGTYTYGCTGGSCPSAPATVTASTCPTITISETTRTGFLYCSGSGPSAYKGYNISGSNLTEDITITAPANYEISITSGSGYTSSITLTQSAGTVISTTVYVRLAAGLGVATYNGQTITHSSTGAITRNVTCDGSVASGTSIVVSSATVTGFSGCDGSASSALTYTVTGQCLSGDITVTPPTDYQISVDNFNWVSAPTVLTLSHVNGIVETTTIYVRLKSGLSVASYNTENIVHSGGGASSQNVACSGDIYAIPTASAGTDIYVCEDQSYDNTAEFQVNSTNTAYAPYSASGSYRSGGNESVSGNTIDMTGVTNPAPETVYQSEIWGNHTYTFTGLTTGIVYKVRLHFAETYFSGAGSRLFNVAINGTTELSNYDIYSAAGGQNKAVVEEIVVAPNSAGEIIIVYTGVTDNALSRGVELFEWYDAGQLTASGGTTYLWSTGETTTSIYVGPTTATYTVTATSNGCSSQDDVNVAAGCGTAAPFLTAATSVTVDNAFDVTFIENATWRGLITGITVDGTTLDPSSYSVTAGRITFTPSASSPTTLLQTAGTKTIRVLATGYTNASAIQTISAGVATKLVMKTQPAAPASNGSLLLTQPAVYIQDQYSNVTTSNADVVATIGAGTWTVGGTTTKAGSIGTATFSNLTASAVGSVTGASITFTSTDLTSVTSSTFNIPGISTLTIASASQTTAGNVLKASLDNSLSTFTVLVATATSELSSVTFTTSGTYSASDIVNFKLWYNTSNSLATATQLGGEITSSLGTGSHTFNSLSKALSTTTHYFWITSDISETAETAETIIVDAIANTEIVFAGGSKSGSVSVGGTKTIIMNTSLTGFNYIGAGPSKYQTFNLASTNLSPASGTLTVNAPTDYVICKTADGTYTTTLNYAYTGNTISDINGIVYVKLKAGLVAGTDYNNENITFSGDGGYNALTVSCSGGVGQIYYFRQTGNWNDGNTWALSCGGGAAGSYPSYKDSAVCTCTGMGYDAGYILTVNTDITVGAIFIDRKLDIAASGVTLTVKNSLQLGKTDTWWEGQGSLDVGDGTLIVEGDVILGYNNDSNGLQWDNGNIYIGGNLICSDGGGPSPLEPGTDAYQNQSLKPGGGSESDAGYVPSPPTYVGSIIMTGDNKSIVVNAAAVDLVRVKLESSTISKTGTGTLYITENIDFNGQTDFQNATGSTIISGTITNASNATLTNDAIVEIATATNDLAVHSGTTGSTTEYFTTGDEPVNVGTYYNLIISGGGTKVLQGDIVINNELTFPDAGYIDMNGNDITMNNWVDGNISPINTSDRYIISGSGSGSVFTINDVNDTETANFPIGLSANDMDFCRVDILNGDVANTSFAVTGVVNALYASYTDLTSVTGATSPITESAVDYTWFITSLSEIATVTFYWHNSKQLTGFAQSDCATFHYDETIKWEMKGSSSAAQVFDTDILYQSGAFTKFSPGAVMNGDIIISLPIKLINFLATQNNDEIFIEWNTATEINNDYFTLERSVDGVNWETVYTCNGAGNSIEINTYSFVDSDELVCDYVYYKLKQTDYNGDYVYSKIISVDNLHKNSNIIIYPNPFDGRVLYLKGLKEDADVEIYSSNGALVYNSFIKVTNSIIILNLDEDLIPGTYTFICRMSNKVYMQRLIVD